MPHATEQVKDAANDAKNTVKDTANDAKNSAKDAANGDFGSSKTFSHLTSYPAVSDSIDTFKSNPYGKKSLEIVDSAYARFAKPVEPYLETPYSYAKPYVSKVDELGAKALSRVDGHFPIVKENTDTIFEKTKSTIFWPYTYLSEAWSDEYKKTVNHNGRGEKLSSSILAVISLELRVASDFFHYVADNLRPAYEESKAKADELAGAAQDKFQDLKWQAKSTADDAANKAGELKDTASKKTQEATDSASKKGEELKNTASKKTDEAKSEANKAKDKVTK